MEEQMTQLQIDSYVDTVCMTALVEAKKALCMKFIEIIRRLHDEFNTDEFILNYAEGTTNAPNPNAGHIIMKKPFSMMGFRMDFMAEVVFQPDSKGDVVVLKINSGVQGYGDNMRDFANVEVSGSYDTFHPRQLLENKIRLLTNLLIGYQIVPVK